MIALAATFILAVLLLWFVYRPWALNWGATAEEIVRDLPGDEIVASPTFAATRAVSIAATPEEIWPWIVQIGYRRAGFYSYDRLDNDGIASSDSIIRRYQGLQVGDAIPLSKTASAEVVHLDRGRAMVLLVDGDGPAWTWAWTLRASGDGSTRLLTRLRYTPRRHRTKWVLEFFEIIMMRKHLLGIKRRAEAGLKLDPSD